MTRGFTMTTRGFTIMELVITFLIIGLMAAVAVPAVLDQPERVSLDTAVERVESLLTLARDSAVRRAVPVRVVIDSASALAWITATPTPGAAAQSEPGGAILTLPTGVRLQASEARTEFVFRPSGSAFPDSVLLSDGLGSRLITVNPMSGHVVVEP